jgi:hypothetical protein
MVDNEQEDPGEVQEPQGDLGMRECPNCGETFVVRRSWQLFCSNTCRMRHHMKERRTALKEYRTMMRDRGVGDGK